MLPIGLYPMVHGVNSQVMDGLQELSFTMTPFMVLEETKLLLQQVFMEVPGPKSPMVALLIWLTGMDQNPDVSNIKTSINPSTGRGGKMSLSITDNSPIPSIF